MDPDARPRDPREDRDARDRDSNRAKSDRNSIGRELALSTKDVSPPPLAPSAPAFGSIPSRNPSVADIQSLTGKAPPTGPRALTEERPVSAGIQAGGAERLPPSGPSKPLLPDGSPQIPIGPRAQQVKQQRPSSKQWINPNIVGRKMPDSPKTSRSQSFASQQPRPFGHRPVSAGSDRPGEYDRRPRSSDAKADGHLDSADGQLRSLHLSEPGEIKSERETQSARTSIDRDLSGSSRGLLFRGYGADRGGPSGPTALPDHGISPTLQKANVAQVQTSEQSDVGKATGALGEAQQSRRRLRVAALDVSVPSRQPVLPLDGGSESDDEDFGDFFDSEIAKQQAELKRLEDGDDSLPTESYTRAGLVALVLGLRVMNWTVSLARVLEPIPEDAEIPWNIPEDAPTEAKDTMDLNTEDAEGEVVTPPPAAPDSATVGKGDMRQPKVEDVDMDAPHQPIPTVERDDGRVEDGDVTMHDAAGGDHPRGDNGPQNVAHNGIHGDSTSLLFPPGTGHASRRTTPSQLEEEDDDATEDEELDPAMVEAVRNFIKTPSPDELPDFSCSPWFQDRRVLRSGSPSAGLTAYILGELKSEALKKEGEQEKVRIHYSLDYRDYLHFTLSSDLVAVKSREKFSGGPPPPVVAGPTITGAEKAEGRGSGRRFATERDLERVLQASMREEDERRQREERAQKEKYRSEKEASIPNMYWSPEDRNRDLFIDKAGSLPPEKLVAGWQVLAPIVNFTEEEADIFEKAYLECPKQWGKIAEKLEHRDFQACIQYYYDKKKDLNLKEKLKRQPKKKKKGTRKQRSSALVSELGNGENEVDETAENGENGERRRPRRAAAPTFNCEEARNADSDGPAPAGTPGRRAAAAKADGGAEKAEAKKGRKRVTKDKEPKQPKLAQALAPTPAVASKPNRSRSNSRAQGPEWQSPQAQADVARLPTQFEVPPVGIAPPPAGPAQGSIMSPERPVATALAAPVALAETMAPPSLRPEPLPPQAALASFDISQGPGGERTRTSQQASSYWSVSEGNDFPALLRSFGTDWHLIAAHMQTKTAVMVCSETRKAADIC